MIQQIKDKLKSQYLHQQRVKLESDPYYQALVEKCMTALKYTVPVITIKYGVMSQEVPETYDWAKAQLDEYVKTMYPHLSNRKVGLIEYVKYAGLGPWNRADIVEPDSLSLDSIDRRLTMFKEYLKYRIENYNTTVWFLRLCESKNLLWYWPSETVLEFDEWLYLENHDNLVKIHWHNY